MKYVKVFEKVPINKYVDNMIRETLNNFIPLSNDEDITLSPKDIDVFVMELSEKIINMEIIEC